MAEKMGDQQIEIAPSWSNKNSWNGIASVIIFLFEDAPENYAEFLDFSW